MSLHARVTAATCSLSGTICLHPLSSSLAPPLFHPPPLRSDSRLHPRTCRALAYENLQDIGNFVASIVDRCRGSEWYTLFFAFQASLTLLLSVVWEPNHRSAAAWKAILTSTATWFRQIQSMRRVRQASSLVSLYRLSLIISQLATSYAQILDNVVGVVPSPIALSGPDALAAVFGDSPSSWPSNQNQDQTQTQGALDVERYW